MRTYEVLFPIENDKINIKHGTRLELPSDLEAIANAEWDRRLKNAKGGTLFSAPQYRLSGFDAETQTLYLAPSTYRELIATNGFAFNDPKLFEKFADANCLANVLALCSAIKTEDNKLMIMQRAEGLAEYGGYYHTVGGHPEPKNYVPEGYDIKGKEYIEVFPELIDFKDAMASEIKSELGLTKDNYNLEYRALIENLKSRKPELIFRADVKLTLKEIKEIPPEQKTERWEHVSFDGKSIDEMIDFLNKEEKIVPPGKAALKLSGYLQ